jgi:hypothetical protein
MFALLEFSSMRTEDAHVLAPETYWKGVLLTRMPGHNKTEPGPDKAAFAQRRVGTRIDGDHEVAR